MLSRGSLFRVLIQVSWPKYGILPPNLNSCLKALIGWSRHVTGLAFLLLVSGSIQKLVQCVCRGDWDTVLTMLTAWGKSGDYLIWQYQIIICVAFVQRRPNVFDASPTLYTCHINVLCMLGWWDLHLNTKFHIMLLQAFVGNISF